MKFWLLWGFDALVTLVVLYFFLAGLADGSVSSFNLGLWLTILLILAGVMVGSLAFRSAGHPVIATAILLVLAVPGLLYALFLLVALIAAPRWN